MVNQIFTLNEKKWIQITEFIARLPKSSTKQSLYVNLLHKKNILINIERRKYKLTMERNEKVKSLKTQEQSFELQKPTRWSHNFQVHESKRLKRPN